MFKEVVEDEKLQLSRKERRQHKAKPSRIKVDIKLLRKRDKKGHEIIEIWLTDKT